MGANTYVAVGNAEDISNVITNIEPRICPLTAAIGRTSATGVTHEWLEDSLAAAGANAQPEGFAFTAQSPAPRVLKDNYCQIMYKDYEVTATQEAVLKHGLKSEIGYQMAKASAELARDIEWALINNGAKNLAAMGTARTFGGISPYILPANVDSTTTAMTEAALANSLYKAWKQGGFPNKVFMSGPNKMIVSNFSNSERQRNQKEKSLSRRINVYESDFGDVEFVHSHFIPNTTVLALDTRYLKIAYLRPIHNEVPAHVADTKRRALVGELTLEVRAGGAHAALTGLTTAEPA